MPSRPSTAVPASASGVMGGYSDVNERNSPETVTHLPGLSEAQYSPRSALEPRGCGVVDDHEADEPPGRTMPSLDPVMTIVLRWRDFRGCAEAVSSCVTDAFDTPFENLVEGLVSGLVPLFVQERLREGDERAGVAFSVGQVGRAVGVAVEDEEVFAVDNPTKTEFAEPAQLLAGYWQLTPPA